MCHYITNLVGICRNIEDVLHIKSPHICVFPVGIYSYMFNFDYTITCYYLCTICIVLCQNVFVIFGRLLSSITVIDSDWLKTFLK